MYVFLFQVEDLILPRLLVPSKKKEKKYALLLLLTGRWRGAALEVPTVAAAHSVSFLIFQSNFV